MHKPYALKVELVRGCTRRCPFCAHTSMEWVDEPFRYMDLKLLGMLVNELACWHPKHRFELANRGEPTVHPRFMEAITMIRGNLPKAQILITTNGDKVNDLGKEAFREFVFESLARGGNYVLIDCYTKDRYQQFSELFPEADLFFEDRVNPYHYKSIRTKRIVLKDASGGFDINTNEILYYHNQGGNVDPEKAKLWGITNVENSLPLMCVRPFRELTVHYDGTVPICCDDWREERVIGKFPHQSLETIWKGFDPYRLRLIGKDRGFSPCEKCSVKSGGRSGLEMSWFKGDLK
jgi:MoaA/NifB/PqqE/SkfB family radical SAM enzyme